MNSSLWRYSTLILAVVIYLYFWIGWWCVLFCAVAILLLLCYRAYRRYKIDLRLNKYRYTDTTVSTKVEQSSAVSIENENLKRRRTQIATFEQFILRLNRAVLYSRLASRFYDWLLDYLRADLVYSTDLYDYLLERAKKRLNSAQAEYLKSELRVMIDVVRLFMRGQSVEDVVNNLKER